MFPIINELSSIRGINKVITDRLNQHKIHSIPDLQGVTQTPEDRQSLAGQVRVNEKSIYIWAKQADLMRIEGIDAVTAELLVKVGVRNIQDLAEADTNVLKKLIDVYVSNDNIGIKASPGIDDLNTWKSEAAALDNKLVNNADDLRLELIMEGGAPQQEQDPFTGGKVVESSFFCDMSEMMVEVGRGVAEAQHKLDLSSIDVQQYIESKEDLRDYGLTATWYVMPETTFNMKVNYSMVREETEEGTKLSHKRMIIAPINAKYQNYFKSTTSSESELRFKIVPVPPPVKDQDES